MNFRKSLLALVLFGLTMGLTAVSVPAQEITPEQLAMARRVVDARSNNDFYRRAIIETTANASRVLVNQQPSLSTEIANASAAVIETYMTREGDLYDQFARIYAVAFTMGELEQIATFYESEAGKKLQSTDDEISNQLRLAIRVWASNLNTDILNMMKTRLREAGHEF